MNVSKTVKFFRLLALAPGFLTGFAAGVRVGAALTQCEDEEEPRVPSCRHGYCALPASTYDTICEATTVDVYAIVDEDQQTERDRMRELE